MNFTHWGKNPQFVQKYWNLIFDKVRIFKRSFLSKFTISKSHFFCQNSHFQILKFYTIHICKVSFFTKFTFYKHKILGNFLIKVDFVPSVILSHVWKIQDFLEHVFEHPGCLYFWWKTLVCNTQDYWATNHTFFLIPGVDENEAPLLRDFARFVDISTNNETGFLSTIGL